MPAQPYNQYPTALGAMSAFVNAATSAPNERRTRAPPPGRTRTTECVWFGSRARGAIWTTAARHHPRENVQHTHPPNNTGGGRQQQRGGVESEVHPTAPCTRTCTSDTRAGTTTPRTDFPTRAPRPATENARRATNCIATEETEGVCVQLQSPAVTARIRRTAATPAHTRHVEPAALLPNTKGK